MFGFKFYSFCPRIYRFAIERCNTWNIFCFQPPNEDWLYLQLGLKDQTCLVFKLPNVYNNRMVWILSIFHSKWRKNIPNPGIFVQILSIGFLDWRHHLKSKPFSPVFVCTFSWKENKCYTITKWQIQGFRCNNKSLIQLKISEIEKLFYYYVQL